MSDDWINKAACKGIAAEEVLPIICYNRCPVRKDCLKEALQNSDWHRGISYEPHLVWGGHTANSRQTAMDATGFRSKLAYKFLLEREKNGPSNKLRSGDTQSAHPSNRHS